MDLQRRNRTRTKYSAHALIKSTVKGSVKGVVRDISLESIYLLCNHNLSIDEVVRLEIVILGRDSELIVKVPGKVVRKDQKGVAVIFFEHLEWWPIFTYFQSRQIARRAA